MRTGLIIAGIVFLIAGLWVTVGNASYKQTDTLVQVGSAKLEATHSQAVPQWLGIAGIVIGGLLLAGGIVSKNR